VTLKESNLSKRTIARRTAVLRTFFRFLSREGYRKDNPISGIQSQKLEKKLPMVLDETEVAKLLEAPELDLAGRRDRAHP
jgi:integrase/recombinase XerC